MNVLSRLGLIAVLGVLLLTSASGPAFSILYRFGSPGDGVGPNGLISFNGVFYGATVSGGTSYLGTIYELQPPATPGAAWTETVLHSFAGGSADGCIPFAGPVAGPNGALYGATEQGGPSDGGTVYVLQPPAAPGGPWVEKMIYAFTGGADGRAPSASVVLGPGGQVYGTTQAGGATGWGTAFELSPPAGGSGAWTEKVLHSFTNGADGGEPFATPTLGPDGALYGTVYGGGAYGVGAVYKLTPPTVAGGDWTEAVLYSFTGGVDGFAPTKEVVLGKGGTLYGTTDGSDSAPRGTVFQLTPPASPGDVWTESVIYDFSGEGDGADPNSPLLLAGGNIYGTTVIGTGASNKGGSVFELQPPSTPGGAWTEVVLHGFAQQKAPYGNLVVGKDGAVYGNMSDQQGHGPNAPGIVYRIAP
jgi:uncharacterized repeat protein (TIGR03803 family)